MEVLEKSAGEVTERVQSAFELQKKYSFTLRTEPIGIRLERLKKLERWVLDHQPEIREALAKDLDKHVLETDISEILPVLTEIREGIKNLKSWAKPKKYQSSFTFLGSSAEVIHEPKGVCLIISPWNYPFNLTLGPIVSALAAGNCVIIKPSEFTSSTSTLIKQMIESLFEEKLAVVLEGDAHMAEELLKLPFDHIFFTGSPQVGKIVMSAAARHLTSVTLELGGKSPTIVDETSDTADAAKKIAWGKWLNAGQTCVAPDYLFVHRSKISDLVKKIQHYADVFYKDASNYSSIINVRHFNRIAGMIQEAGEVGILHFGGETNLAARKIAPTIVELTSTDSLRAMEEEIFGPLLPVIAYDNLEEVISYINARPKPLALYLFTKSNQNEQRILQETSSGTVVINDCLIQFGHPTLPFGGVNTSGIGKSHGHAGFLAFSNEKATIRQRIGFTMPQTLYPPYSSIKNKTVQFLLKYF